MLSSCGLRGDGPLLVLPFPNQYYIIRSPTCTITMYPTPTTFFLLFISILSFLVLNLPKQLVFSQPGHVLLHQSTPAISLSRPRTNTRPARNNNGVRIPLVACLRRRRLVLDCQRKQTVREGSCPLRQGHARPLAKHCQGSRQISSRSQTTLRHPRTGP